MGSTRLERRGKINESEEEKRGGRMKGIGKIGVARVPRRAMRKAINIARLDLGSRPLSGLLTNTEGASINHWTLINGRTKLSRPRH